MKKPNKAAITVLLMLTLQIANAEQSILVPSSNKTTQSNQTPQGCGRNVKGLWLVCEYYSRVKPDEIRTYKYNWGVTRTWMNISDADQNNWPSAQTATEATLITVTSSPCATGADDSYKSFCYKNNWTIETKADKYTCVEMKTESDIIVTRRPTSSQPCW